MNSGWQGCLGQTVEIVPSESGLKNGSGNVHQCRDGIAESKLTFELFAALRGLLVNCGGSWTTSPNLTRSKGS